MIADPVGYDPFMTDPTTAEVDEFEDPSDSEEDLGTADVLSIGEDAPIVTPVTESLFSVLTSVQDGSIVLQPPYQRRAFWDRKKKSSLVESVYLGLPLPLFYLADARASVQGEVVRTREVVDGQQRLTSLLEFYKGNLVIPDDSIIEDLRGKTFQALRPSLKQVFKDFKLSTATIPISARADKFELFRRLNQQSTVLSDQELRNAAFHGPYLNFIKTEAENLKDLLRVTDAEWRRMKDVEYLTRLLAFERRGYDAFPNKRLNKFLNDEMVFGASESDDERAKRIKRVRKSLERVKLVFGDFRFRPYRIPEHGYEGEWSRSVNRALMEAQCWTFWDHGRYGFQDSASFDAALRDRREDIVESVRRLHAYTDRFNDSIQRGTTGLPNVIYRFSRFSAAVGYALQAVSGGRRQRFFSLQQKQNIWDALAPEERTCSECGNALVFQEAEVDHIRPFAEGGATTEGNGQLLHRACNRAKGARWDPVEETAPP